MELYEEILLHCSKTGKICLDINTEDLVHDIAYQSMKKIKLILEQDQLDDRECFWRIEEVVRVFEEIGSDGGSRHDFG